MGLGYWLDLRWSSIQLLRGGVTVEIEVHRNHSIQTPRFDKNLNYALSLPLFNKGRRKNKCEKTNAFFGPRPLMANLIPHRLSWSVDLQVRKKVVVALRTQKACNDVIAY